MKILGVLIYLLSASLSCAFLYFTVSDIPVAGVDLALQILMALIVIVALLRILEGLAGPRQFTPYEEY